MSKTQKLLAAIADEMKNGTITAEELDRLVKALDGVNGIYHADLVCSAFSVKEDE